MYSPRPGSLIIVIFIVLCTATALARAETEAVVGHPFGVARVTLPLDADPSSSWQSSVGISVRDRQGRIFYPAFDTGGLANLVAELLGDLVPRDAAGTLSVSFLFTGRQPLEVTVDAPHPHTVVVTPRVQPQQVFDRALRRWWRDYHAAARQPAGQGDYPPLVETYLTSMLAQRLELRPPLLSRLQEEPATEAGDAFQLLLGVEKLRAATMRETMRERGAPEAASQAVPPEILWSPPEVGEPDGAVAVEPIAMRVPAECFYIRFGSFANYRWFSRLMQDYGGDITRMVTLRGQDDRLNQRLQDRLALQESLLADLLGGQVIADVAIIGRDLYLREGPAMGVLFQARNDLGLATDLQRQRIAALEAEQKNGATLETVQIEDRDVSLLSTPDNRLRSYYAVEGGYHLVTTSRAIAERFFQAGEGRGALGSTRQFQHARQRMPLERDDTIFAFFSSDFFAALMSPQYQIELRRRLKAVTDMELVQLARRASAAEGHSAQTIEDLVRGGFLPPGFGRNADGSGPILETHRVIDSLRGARGSFVPITDVELRGLTPREASRYLDQARYFQSEWNRMDPLMVAVQRRALELPGMERIEVDAEISPLAEDKYGWLLSLLGPPSSQQIAAAPGDIVTIQAMVQGGLLRPDIPAHHLFLGIQDIPAASDLRGESSLQGLRILRETPGYLGAWPKLSLLDLLPLGAARQTERDGFTRLPLGIWRWQNDDISVLSFQRDVLQQVAPHLKPEAAASPAQIRVRVGSLADSQLASFVNVLNYERARQASLGNARLLHQLSQQLAVPPQDALEVAQDLLDTRLVCTLGGQYELAAADGALTTWRSTAWPDAPDVMPPDYQAPLLEWFRGLQLELIKTDARLQLHARMDMQRKPSELKLNLPFLDLFRRKKDEPSSDDSRPAPDQPRE